MTDNNQSPFVAVEKQQPTEPAKPRTKADTYFDIVAAGIGWGALIGAIAGVAAGVGTAPIFFFFSGPIGAGLGVVGGIVAGIPTACFTYWQRTTHPHISKRRIAVRVTALNVVLMLLVVTMMEVLWIGRWDSADSTATGWHAGMAIVFFAAAITSFFSAMIFDNSFAKSFKSEYPPVQQQPTNSALLLMIGISSCFVGLCGFGTMMLLSLQTRLG